MNQLKARTRIWQTATFRLALVFSVIFGIGSAALLAMLDYGITRAAEQELEDSLRSQMAIMRADANLEGGAALVEVLAEHHASGDPSPYSYLVITPDGRRFNAGLPEDMTIVEGIHRISVPSTNSRPGKGGEMMDLQVLADTAADGTLMAVARATSQLDELRNGLHRIAIAGGVGLTILAILAGLALGSMVLRRLDRVSSAAELIVGGDSMERLPSVGFGREFDALVANLNRMLDRLGGAMTALRQVSTDLAHDLRTPLSRLRNTLDDPPAGETEHNRAWAERGIAEIDEALGVLNALLRIAQIEGTDRNAAQQAVDIRALVEPIVEAYRPDAEDSGHTLRVDVEAECRAEADPGLLKQLIANLLDNAIRHTPAGTGIEIAVHASEDRVVVSVADNGPGVPAAERANVVKRLYRLDRSRSTPGAGLGLTLAKAIAELHGSDLVLADNNPGLRVSVALKRA